MMDCSNVCSSASSDRSIQARNSLTLVWGKPWAFDPRRRSQKTGGEGPCWPLKWEQKEWRRQREGAGGMS